MSRDDLDELDGVTAAPNQHKVILENEAVRVIETRIAAGETTPLHTHMRPQVQVVLWGSHFVRRDEHGGTMLDTKAVEGFELSRVAFAQPLGRHSIENTGADDLVVISVELKPATAG